MIEAYAQSNILLLTDIMKTKGKITRVSIYKLDNYIFIYKK